LATKNYRQPPVSKFKLCEVRRPRHWFGEDGFRGTHHSAAALVLLSYIAGRYWLLERTGSMSKWTYLFYVIDLAKCAKEKYRQKVYREFHGMLGEARASLIQSLVICFTRAAEKDAYSGRELLTDLCFHPSEIPSEAHNCPHVYVVLWHLCSVFVSSVAQFVVLL
jgi:hypothetical protein